MGGFGQAAAAAGAAGGGAGAAGAASQSAAATTPPPPAPLNMSMFDSGMVPADAANMTSEDVMAPKFNAAAAPQIGDTKPYRFSAAGAEPVSAGVGGGGMLQSLLAMLGKGGQPGGGQKAGDQAQAASDAMRHRLMQQAQQLAGSGMGRRFSPMMVSADDMMAPGI